MSNRKAAILLVCQLLLTSWTLIGVVSASSTPPTTTIAITTSYDGVVSDGNSVYVSANPEFTLTYTLSNNNSSFINSEYEIVEGSQSSGISNYSAAVTVWANHSTNVTVNYRSNSTTGLEAWKSLNLIVDADLPTLTISSNNSSALRYKQNQSVYVTSNLTPLTFSCVDTISGVANLSASIGSQQFNSNSSSLSLNNLPNSISGNNTFAIVVICKDNVNNELNRTYTVILDDSIPTLSYTEMGVRSQKLTSDCISADWGINVQSSDLHSNSHVERWDVNSWNQVSNSIGVSSNFSGDIILRASDAVGLSSSNQSWNVTVDSTLPIIQHNINSGSLSINSSDNCGIASMQYRWETFDGQNFGWTDSQNASISVPSVLNGSIIRAQIKATDVIGNTNYSTTSWINTNGSLPYSTISVLSNRYGNTITDNASFSLTPVGYQSNASWELFVNNVSDSSGNTSSQITINKEFSHQDSIRIEINTTDGLSNYSVYNWTYVVDSSNSHQILISVSGDFLGATNLTLGPTGRLVPGLPSDDSSGVGGSHASCSWNEVDWFQVQANSSYFPSTNPGTTVTFDFACRSVDLLGNEGPITWRNGSVDLESPTISLQPGSSSTIGPNSTITVNFSDSSGISSSDISIVWTNSSSTAYSNTSLGSSNISSSIYQLFPGLVDGIITATLTVEDNVGNTQYVSKVWTLNTSKPFITVSLSGEYNGQFVTNDSTGFTLSLPSGGWVGLSTNYTLTDSNGSVVDTGNINSTKTLNPTGLLEGNLTLDVLTTDSLGKSQSQNWTYYVDSSNSHQVMISVSGGYTGTVSPILGPTGRLVPGLPLDESSGVGGSHVNCSWNGINWFQVNTNSSFAPTTNPGSTQSFVFACRSVDLFGNQGPITWNNGSVDLQSPNVSMQPSSSSTIGPNSTIVNNFTDDTGIHSSTLLVVWTNGSSTNSSVTSHGNSNFTATLSQLLNSLGDGTITATLTVEDTVGNTQSVTRVWTLNTSKPFITVSLSGKYQAQFVTNDSTGFTLTLPSGGWVGLTANYTLTDSSGSVVSTGDITSTTTLNPNGLLEGNLTLDVLTTDSLGKAQSQNWTYYVDSSNGQSPVISIDGLNLTSSNVTWMGVGSTFKISSISDDSNGVGANRASCSWDESNWFDVGSSNSVTPSTFSGQHETHTLTCKNVDFLGNEGPTTQYNASTDRILPLQSISPSSSSHISPGSSISVDLSDQSGIQSSIVNISWSNGTSSWSTSVQIYSLNWNSSINSIKSGLTDGIISVDLYTIDNLGNENKTTGHFWYLNTSEPISSINLVGQNYGSYVQGGEDFAIGLTPPTIANSNGWAIYTLEHSNGTQLGTGNISSYTEIGYGQNSSLTSGTIWLNITSYDIFMRSKIQNWTFIVDNSVGTFPNYSIQGSAINKSGNPILGPSGYIGIASLQDDVGGVGYSHANCTWDNSTWFNSNLTSVMIPSSTSGSNVSFNLGCSIVDLLGNQGAFKWINGEVDSIKPAISYNITSGSLLSSNSSFNISCTDKNGCSLSQVTIFFNNGSNSLWKSTTISGSTSGVTISSLLNATSSGTMTFYSIATDQLGNSRNQSSVSFQYLHDLPTIITTINSENSGSYIDNNLTFTVIPSSGWMTGINVSMTVKHSNSTTFSYNGSVNQSTSQQTYNNLSEGDIWINTTICDLLSRCSNSTVHLYVDNTAPSAPSFSISGGYQYQNQSYLLQGSSIFVVQRGSDTASKTLKTVCNSSNSVVSFTTSQNSISVQSMIGSEEWSTIYCKSTDKVGNVGNSAQITIRRDDTSPTVSISDQSISGIIAPSKWYNSTCNDNVLVENQNLKVFSNSNLLYQTNSTGNISIRYGSISNLGANGLIDIELTCTDEAGNEKTDSRRLEWLPYLSPSTISVSGIQQNSTYFVTDQATITISNPRSDVYHEYRYIINGTTGSWITENSTSFTLNVGDGNDSKNLRIQLKVLKEGTSFSNTTYSNLMSIDLTGPTVSLDSNPTVSNGSLIDLSSSYSGVEISYYVWSWNNGSTIQSNSLGDVILPSSNESSAWLSISGYDKLGNQGSSLNASIIRDITPPDISMNNSHPGYLGPSTQISIGITETTGVLMSKIWMNSTSGQSKLIASNTTSYQLSSTDYPNWIWNQTSVQIVVEVQSNSGIYASDSMFVVPDNVSPSLTISNQSSNIYGYNTSNHSLISLQKPGDLGEYCVKIGLNYSVAESTSCLTESSFRYSYSRSQGNYVMVINSTDYAGNNLITTLSMIHHTTLPSINSSIPNILKSGTNQSFAIQSLFETTADIRWNGNQVQDNGGWFQVPSGLGNATLIINVTDVLGLSSSNSWIIKLDNEGPMSTIDSDFYSSNNFGTNSILYLNVTENISTISFVEINVSSGSSSCLNSWIPTNDVFTTNGTLAEILQNSSCSVLGGKNLPILLKVYTRDNLGNDIENSWNLIYHGDLESPVWVTDYTQPDSNYHWISAHSNFTCSAGVGTILESITLSWSGTDGQISNDSITNLTSNGVISCEVSDIFGNNISSNLNVTFDSSNPLTSIVWPDNSQYGLIKSGFANFTVNSSDVQSGIHSILYCISVQYCNPSHNYGGHIPINITNGSGTLNVSVMNNVRIFTNLTINFTVDNLGPTVIVANRSNTVIDGSTIYTGNFNPKISVNLIDDRCINGGYYQWDNGNTSISTSTNISLPINATWIKLVAIDCVGHESFAFYNIAKIYSIQNASISKVASDMINVLITNDSIYHNGTLVIQLHVTHNVPVNIQCNAAISISCYETNMTNTFEFATQNTGSIVPVEFTFSDELGNINNQTIRFEYDGIGPSCTPNLGVVQNTTELILSRTVNSIFDCGDDLSGIREVYWLDNQNTIYWTKSANNSWIASPPIFTNLSLVIVDNVNNKNSTSFQIYFDDLSPQIVIEPVNNSISFDEKLTRSDSEFLISCLDDTGMNCFIELQVEDLTNSVVLQSHSFTNHGNVSLLIPDLDSNVRISVSVLDKIGNSKSISELFRIDDKSPEVFMNPYSEFTNQILPQGIVSYQGEIRLDNYTNSEINETLSSNIIVNCTNGQFSYSLQITKTLFLSDLNLSSCSELNIYLRLSDHVGNVLTMDQIYSIDYLIPQVNYSVNESCSWFTGLHYDMQSTCELSIDIIDDTNRNVSSVFTMKIFQNGQLVNTQLVNGSFDVGFSQYPNSSISVVIQGSDLTGKPMASTNIDIVTRDDVNPIWVGLICSGNQACDWNDILSSSLNDTIGVVTPINQAPIVSVNFAFENTQSDFTFDYNFFNSSSLPDDSYLLSTTIVDSAGREFSSLNVPFVYDNEAPEIEILGALSNGLINETLVLSCDECELYWRVNEISGYSTDTNHGSFVSGNELYYLSTSTLGENFIRITAVDSFGRVSQINVSTTPVRTTSITVVEDLFESDQISIQCLEASSVDDFRNVNCLWKRKESTITNIPIQIDMDIDRPELRDVNLIIYKSGGGIETIDATSGIMNIPYINHYTNTFELELSDKYSDIGNIRYTLHEHTNAWSDIELINPQISEDASFSNFNVALSPPVGEEEFYLLRRGMVGLNDLFDCYSTYSFAKLNDLSVRENIENCELDPQSLIFLEEGKIVFVANVNHSQVRNGVTPYPEHYSTLFNLEYYSLGVKYSDDLGVSTQSSVEELTIDSEQIIRTLDSLPSFDSSMNRNCPLGSNNLDIKGSDGFLQSQATSPLSSCQETIIDSDGVNRIIWRFTFIDGNQRLYSEVECVSTYFPPDWNFQDAIDASLCQEPSNRFPSGVYNVVVRPWVVDESIFVRDSREYYLSENGFYAKPIIEGDCSEIIGNCKFVEFELFDVVVSSSLDPISEVENSKNLVENAGLFVDSWLFTMIMCASLLSIGIVVRNFYRKYRNTIAVSPDDNVAESENELTADQVRLRFQIDDQVFTNILDKYGISESDRDDFLTHVVNFDENYDGYISTDEMTLAAEDWVDNRYSNLTVMQLKEQLRARGLPVSGNKSDLISRLKE